MTSVPRCRMPDAGRRFAVRWFPVLLGFSLLLGIARAQPSLPASDLPPVPPAPKSPVGFFRQLLAMSPEQRVAALTNRSEKSRTIILSRIGEYTALSPDERELRLKAMHLRWLLLPLLKAAPADRARALEALAPADRALVAARVRRWNVLAPDLQAQFLEHEAAIDYFTRIQNSTLPPMPPGLSPELDEQRRRLDLNLRRWNAVPGADRGRMLGQFRDFFELDPEDLSKTIDHLNANERRLLSTARARFAGLTEQERRSAMVAFERLARMNQSQRTAFFRNVEKWQTLSPAEKHVWRELTKRVPELPPLPPGMFPPLPGATNSVASVNY